MQACTYLYCSGCAWIIASMSLLIVLCSELGHSIVVGPAHGTGVPPANPKLAHFCFFGVQYRDLVNEAPHTLVQHLNPMCPVHPSLDLGLPRLVQGEPVHIEQDPKGSTQLVWPGTSGHSTRWPSSSGGWTSKSGDDCASQGRSSQHGSPPSP